MQKLNGFDFHEAVVRMWNANATITNQCKVSCSPFDRSIYSSQGVCNKVDDSNVGIYLHTYLSFLNDVCEYYVEVIREISVLYVCIM